VPFNSFDVRGLAACGTAVVGVGVLNPGGRVQSSPDGLSWTESVSSFPAGLNAIVQYDLGRFIAVGANGLIIDSTAWADTPVNVWTKTTDGYWHEAHWSLGHVPTWKDYSVVLTNAGFKTLEIDGNTTTDYPDSLKLNALILDAPEGSHNSLWLNNAGLSVPLQINSTLRIPQNTSLVCGNSALVASRLELSGQARFTGDASAVFEHGIIVGMTGTGVVYQVSGSILAEGVQIGGNVPGSWNQFGGVLEVGAEGLTLGAGSTYALTAGQLLTSDLRLGPSAELNIRGGSAQATAVVIPGGTLTLSQGTLITSNATIGGVASTPGRFVQAGGEHRVEDILTIEGVYEFRDGLLKYRLMRLKGELNSDREGGIWNSDVEFDGGILRVNTDRYFNRITLLSTGTIDLRSAAALIRFEMTGPWSGILVVTNWLPNASHLQIGRSDSGLSPAQLSQIRFVNPGGFSPGIYSARILSSGEVVPVPRLVSYRRSGNSLVLSWPTGYRLLTATNVAGPYSLLTNAISPYTAYYTDPQRFFITANEN